MGALGLLELLFIIVLFVFPLMALIDILKSNFKENVNKVAWLLAVIFVPILGAFLYFSIGINQKRKS